MEDKQEKPDTINMLLDIEKFSGEFSGRMTPVLVFLLLAGAPALIFVYLFVGKINILYLLPFYIIYVIRLAMITVGKESKRVEEFKRQLHDQYSSALDLINIKTIHPDGCLEYINNTTAYLVIASNGSYIDELQRAQIVRRFILKISDGYNIDILVQNIVASDELSRRYDGVKFYSNAEVANDFIEIIDHNREIISSNSLITQVVFIVKSRKSDYKKLKETVESAINSQDAKAFKALTLATDKEVYSILSRDIDAYLDFNEMQRKKYRKGNYYGSEVIGYDLHEVKEDKKVDTSEERGFMIRE